MTFFGVDEAIRALAAGRPVVVPNPSPQAYGVIATEPRVVNAAKGRPVDQEVGASLHDEREWQQLVPSLDLTPAAVATAHALLRQERVTLLAPLRDATPPPAWLRPAVRDGHVLVFGADLSRHGAPWAPLAALWARFPRLYGSSANRTGEQAASTAGAARRMFGGDVAVVDGDAQLDPDRAHAPTTMLRIAPDGVLALVRPGAQDAEYGGGPAYLQRLAELDPT